jgi:hypothetical protein
VSLDYPNGIITTYNLNISALNYITFTVNNTLVSSGDQVFTTITNVPSPLSNNIFPMVAVSGITNNSFDILLRNPHPTSACTGEYGISYQIIKAIP